MNKKTGKNKKCVFCKKKFYVQNSLLHISKYCSRECKHRAQIKIQKVYCDYCNKKLFRTPSQLRINKHNYCSLECRNKNVYRGGVKESKKRYYQRKKRDIHFKIKNSVSWLVRNRLKKRLLSKKGIHTFDILPYTIDELIKHLEDNFESWMNWNNYGFKKGQWNIDHIIPDSSFNYKSINDEEFNRCWALDNLRPLEALSNYLKKDRIL